MEHKSELRRGKHHSIALQNACNKHGFENLEFSVLLICDERSLLMYEQLTIDAYAPSYNILPLAGRRVGFSPNEETRKRMSASAKARKDRKHSPETRKKISDAHKALGTVPLRGSNPVSDETKKKISDHAKTRTDHLELMRQTRVGHVPSAETREKRRASMTGKKQSQETCDKKSLALTGRKMTEATKENISLAKKGKKLPPRTPEHTEKIRIAKLAKKNARA